MAKQSYIRTEYDDGSVVLSNIRKKRSSIPVYGVNENYTATKVSTWYDGTPMTPEKADGSVYLQLKNTEEYFRINLPNWGETFLEKNTMAQMRGLSPVEILLLKAGYYKGVGLSGYYKEGDTPNRIEYYLSDTVSEDDGGSVIAVGGIKLEHDFVDFVDVSYFGIIEGQDSSIRIQEILNNGFKLDGSGKVLTLNSPIIVTKINLRNCTISSKNSEDWSSQNYIITAEDLDENSSLSSLIFDGSSKTGGLRLTNSSKLFIKDCKFINNGYIGLYLDYCNEIDVVNSYTENNGWNYISLGNSGIRFEYCNYCKLDNYTAKNEYGKVATFSNSTYCSLSKFICTDSDTEQPIIYLSRGSNNTCFDLTIRGSKHPLKLSRQESNSLVSNFFFDSSDFSMTGYSSILIQGGINNVINNGKLVNRTTDAIRVESHPSSPTDPMALSNALNNLLHDITIDVTVPSRYALYVASNVAENVYADNTVFKNITVNGGGNLTSFSSCSASGGTDIRKVKFIGCISNGTTSTLFELLRGSEVIIEGGNYISNGVNPIVAPANHYANILIKNAIFDTTSSNVGLLNYSGTGAVSLVDNIVTFTSTSNLITVNSSFRIDILRNIFKSKSSNRNIVISDTVTSGRIDGNSIDGTITANGITTAGSNYTSAHTAPVINNWDATFNIKGVAELATQTETNLGEATDKIVTPVGLANKFATVARTGVVKMASAQNDISQADLVAVSSSNATPDTASTATDVAELLTDFNDLVSRYNVMVTLVNELKDKYNTQNVPLTNANKVSQNTELTNQRTAGQQAT